MLNPDEELDRTLERLALSTQDITPSPAFSQHVMDALPRESSMGLPFGIFWNVSKRALLISIGLTLLCLILSNITQRSLDKQTLTAFELVEVDE
jgi:hypothetical protein